MEAPPVIGSRPGSSRWWWAGLIAGILGVAVLFRFDPARHAFYPRCLFHESTGLLCPGCGALRGSHALLHGHWLTALRMNALVFGVLPLAVAMAVRRQWRRGDGIRLDRLRLTPAAGYWILGGLLLFGILRNLPWYPFTLLAP